MYIVYNNCVHVTPVQLMEHGIGLNTSCTMGDFL